MSTSPRIAMQDANDPTTTTTISSASASSVVNNVDLLIKILIHLPIRSLLKFKLVSKHWRSLIKSNEFANLRTPFPKTPSGLFLRIFSSLNRTPHYNFIEFISPYPNINNETLYSFGEYFLGFTVEEPFGFKISQSCNGLFLCSSSLCNPRNADYYICNPSTYQYSEIPKQGFNKDCGNIVGVSLAFDPSKSPHYKVVCIGIRIRVDSFRTNLYNIQVFSSKTGSWRIPSYGSFSAIDGTLFNRGVFCNGHIHWYCTFGGNSLSMNVDEGYVRYVPLPPRPDDWGERMVELFYFGTCCGHLHLIEIYERRTLKFSVYEMQWDFLGWSVKYNVDLNEVPIIYPMMIRDDIEAGDFNYYVFSILSVVESDVDEEDAFLVLNTPGKVVRFDLHGKGFFELCDIADTRDDIGDSTSSIMMGNSQAFMYFECLSRF